MPAIIGQKAPAFKSQAVVDGMIKEISSDDYKGVSAAACYCSLSGRIWKVLLCVAPITLLSWGFARFVMDGLVVVDGSFQTNQQ